MEFHKEINTYSIATQVLRIQGNLEVFSQEKLKFLQKNLYFALLVVSNKVES